jgi:predicted tellurium resistance membrane protein TerC
MGLLFELAPDIEAKIIVVSILTVMTILCVLELIEEWRSKQIWLKTFWSISLALVGISLVAEILPEVQAKMVVISALSLSLVSSLVEISITKSSRRI